MRSLLVVCALAACGGSSRSTPPPEAPDNTAPAPTGEPTAAQVCDRIIALRAEGCELVAGDEVDAAACQSEYEAGIADAEAGPLTRKVGACFVEHPTCDAATTCVQDVIASYLGSAQTQCERGGELYGAKAVRFADAPSSMEQPIEVCGVDGQTAWLTRVTCADGSNPFGGDHQKAHDARAGSVGTGGRCDQIIDQYQVVCPEKTYDVYIDMYACP